MYINFFFILFFVAFFLTFCFNILNYQYFDAESKLFTMELATQEKINQDKLLLISQYKLKKENRNQYVQRRLLKKKYHQWREIMKFIPIDSRLFISDNLDSLKNSHKNLIQQIRHYTDLTAVKPV